MYIPLLAHSPLARHSNHSRRRYSTIRVESYLRTITFHSRQLDSLDSDDLDASRSDQLDGNHVHAVNIPEGDEEKARGVIMGMSCSAPSFSFHVNVELKLTFFVFCSGNFSRLDAHVCVDLQND